MELICKCNRHAVCVPSREGFSLQQLPLCCCVPPSCGIVWGFACCRFLLRSIKRRREKAQCHSFRMPPEPFVWRSRPVQRCPGGWGSCKMGVGRVNVSRHEEFFSAPQLQNSQGGRASGPLIRFCCTPMVSMGVEYAGLLTRL